MSYKDWIKPRLPRAVLPSVGRPLGPISFEKIRVGDLIELTSLGYRYKGRITARDHGTITFRDLIQQTGVSVGSVTLKDTHPWKLLEAAA